MRFEQTKGGMHLHVRTFASLFLHIGNGWAHFAEIWCVIMDQLAVHFIYATSGIHLQVLTCIRLFPYHGIQWTHHAEILSV